MTVRFSRDRARVVRSRPSSAPQPWALLWAQPWAPPERRLGLGLGRPERSRWRPPGGRLIPIAGGKHNRDARRRFRAEDAQQSSPTQTLARSNVHVRILARYCGVANSRPLRYRTIAEQNHECTAIFCRMDYLQSRRRHGAAIRKTSNGHAVPPYKERALSLAARRADCMNAGVCIIIALDRRQIARPTPYT